jgi:hypothetical protein
MVDASPFVRRVGSRAAGVEGTPAQPSPWRTRSCAIFQLSAGWLSLAGATSVEAGRGNGGTSSGVCGCQRRSVTVYEQ